MGCGNSKAPAAAPTADGTLMKAPQANDDKKISDYVKMLAAAENVDVTTALQGLSEENRLKLVEALSTSAPAPAKALAEDVVEANATNPTDVNGAVAGVDSENKEKLEDAIADPETKAGANEDDKKQDEPALVETKQEDADDKEQAYVDPKEPVIDNKSAPKKSTCGLC